MNWEASFCSSLVLFYGTKTLTGELFSPMYRGFVLANQTIRGKKTNIGGKRSVNVLICKLQLCSNVIFSKQWLPSWCPVVGTLLVQCFKHCWLMNGDVSQFQWCLQIFGFRGCFFMSPTSPCCALGVILTGHPLLGRVATVPKCLHL